MLGQMNYVQQPTPPALFQKFRSSRFPDARDPSEKTLHPSQSLIGSTNGRTFVYRFCANLWSLLDSYSPRRVPLQEGDCSDTLSGDGNFVPSESNSWTTPPSANILPRLNRASTVRSRPPSPFAMRKARPGVVTSWTCGCSAFYSLIRRPPPPIILSGDRALTEDFPVRSLPLGAPGLFTVLFPTKGVYLA